jgi:hypothetical protein
VHEWNQHKFQVDFFPPLGRPKKGRFRGFWGVYRPPPGGEGGTPPSPPPPRGGSPPCRGGPGPHPGGVLFGGLGNAQSRKCRLTNLRSRQDVLTLPGPKQSLNCRPEGSIETDSNHTADDSKLFLKFPGLFTRANFSSLYNFRSKFALIYLLILLIVQGT